jgi:hypothetical protein
MFYIFCQHEIRSQQTRHNGNSIQREHVDYVAFGSNRRGKTQIFDDPLAKQKATP